MERKDATGRNLAIDMLRALTMTLMIFVNDFWKIHDVPQWMLHAEWGVDFMGLSDFVYPAFLFCVGMSVPYAIESRYRKGLSGESTAGHILLRVLSLLLMGSFIGNSEARLASDFTLYRIGFYWITFVIAFFLIWNTYPKNPSKRKKILYGCLKVLGACWLIFLAATYRRPDGGSFAASFGILGGIAWTYLFAAVTYYFTRNRLKYIVPVWTAVLIVCILFQRLRPEFGDAPIVDLERGNFWEGMLRTLHVGNGGAVLLAMSGLLVSVVTEKIAERPERVKLIVGFGSALAALVLGIITHRWWIAAKLGLTIPCVCFISAIAIAIYTILRFLNRRGLTHWFAIIRPAGTATLTCYMIPYVFYGIADYTGVVLPDWITYCPMGLVKCLCFSLICVGIVGLLGKLNIKLKV